MRLDHRVEALAGDRGDAAEDERHETTSGAGRPECAEGDDDRQRDERTGRQPVLAEAATQQRGDGVAGEGADAIGRDRGCVHPRRLALAAQGERQTEDEEADGRTHDGERPRRGDDRRRVQLLVLDARCAHLRWRDRRQREHARRRTRGTCTQASASVSAGDEVSHSTAPPTAPPTAPATTFSRASRELAATSWSGSSTRAGTIAWRTTPDALARHEQGEGEEVQRQLEQGEGEGGGAQRPQCARGAR